MITRNLLLLPVRTSRISASLSSLILTNSAGRGSSLRISAGVGSFLMNSKLIVFHRARGTSFLLNFFAYYRTESPQMQENLAI